MSLSPSFRKPLLIIGLILLADQLLKFYIKTSMMLGQEHHIADWFIIHFTENNGMAFGFEFEGEFGKLSLTLFRIAALIAIGFYLFRSARKNSNPKLITALSFVFAGAMGNIIDCVFYGKIFSSSQYQIASLFPAEGGYASWLHGKVVDMFYFPVIQTTLPGWVPFWGGEYFVFFRPVFNLADASISIGVAFMLLFQKQIFHHEKGEEQKKSVTDAAAPEQH